MASYQHAFHVSKDNRQIFISSLRIFQTLGALMGFQLKQIRGNGEGSDCIVCISNFSLLSQDLWRLFPYCAQIDLNERIP